MGRIKKNNQIMKIINNKRERSEKQKKEINSTLRKTNNTNYNIRKYTRPKITDNEKQNYRRK